MPLMFIIPLAIVVLVTVAGLIGVICEIAYEQGYDDACHDWRNTVLYERAEWVVDAERVIDSDDVAKWREWAERNALDAGGYPYSSN